MDDKENWPKFFVSITGRYLRADNKQQWDALVRKELFLIVLTPIAIVGFILGFYTGLTCG